MNVSEIMHSVGVLGGNAETLEKYENQRFASKSNKIAEIHVKSYILEGFWVARPKPGK